MKIVILNASPRKNGNIAQMVGEMCGEAERLGADTEVIEVQKLNVRPCIACMKCRSAHACMLPEDDAQRVLEKIKAADALIVAAPCYWGNMPGTLKVLFDRIVYGLMDESPRGIPVGLHKGKRCVLASCSTTPWPLNMEQFARLRRFVAIADSKSSQPSRRAAQSTTLPYQTERSGNATKR